MIKIGDLVRIKPYSEIERIDNEKHLPVPTLLSRKYCGECGVVVRIHEYINHIYMVWLKNIDHCWFSTELEVLDNDQLFICLDSII